MMMRLLFLPVLLLVCTFAACDHDNNDGGVACTADLPAFGFTLTGNDGQNLVRGAGAKFRPDSITVTPVSQPYVYGGLKMQPDSSSFFVSHGQMPKLEFTLRLAPTTGEAKTYRIKATFSGPCLRKLENVTVEGGVGCTKCEPRPLLKLPY